MGSSDPPMREGDGRVGAPHQCSLGAAACCLLFMLTRAVLMPSCCFSCDFSFAGLKEAVRRKVLQMCGGDASLGWEQTAAIMRQPENAAIRADIAASFQAAVCKHLVTRTERAIIFAMQEPALASDADGTAPPLGLISLSGGVACNTVLREAIRKVAEQYGLVLHCPPIELCVDNGVMIAWAGLEYYLDGKDVYPYTKTADVRYTPKWPLGADCSAHVANQSIKVPKPSSRRNSSRG